MHPAMLIHPPIVFLGYAAWAVPFALAFAALTDRSGDTQWLHTARHWTLFAWTVLGAGIILGGNWAYEELGWGGYWAWDPVENGSLLPWLTGTALIHGLLGWHYRGVLKRTTIALALTTFTLCNFATFLTRSGLFSSLHAFSRSPIGWAFLVVMIGLSVCGAVLMFRERTRLAADRVIHSVWSREALIALGTLGLLLLTVVTLAGTLMVPLSDLILGQKIVVGLAFFNNVFIPIGLLLLGAASAAPLLRWGTPPSRKQRKVMLAGFAVGGLTAILAVVGGQRNPITLAAYTCGICRGGVCGGLVVGCGTEPDFAAVEHAGCTGAAATHLCRVHNAPGVRRAGGGHHRIVTGHRPGRRYLTSGRIRSLAGLYCPPGVRA